MLTQARVLIKGDVIGVGFRAWVKIKSKPSGVKGWVRNVFNQPDVFGPHGGVEAVIQGNEQAVRDTLDHIKVGSPISRVDDVEISYEDPTETFSDFSILKSESYSRHG